jgi:hypothetical protein
MAKLASKPDKKLKRYEYQVHLGDSDKWAFKWSEVDQKQYCPTMFTEFDWRPQVVRSLLEEEGQTNMTTRSAPKYC